MGYRLGIDLGTTYTAAAICRDGRAEIATLGTRSAAVPSVLYLGPDGTVLHGEAASRRALTEFDRVVREFKRRVGDPTPLVVGGAPYSAEALAAKQLRWVVDRVAEREGGPPDAITIAHPASWGPYKTDLLAQAARMAGLDDVSLLPEPEAAAIAYAAQERCEPGSCVAVYDLGGGTFDSAILRKTASGGFELLGTPEGIERLGGIDFDESVFAHVDRTLGGALAALDPDDAMAVTAVARLRQECVDAKEALSSDTDVRIPVLLPDVRTEVRLVRAEFEAMIRPVLAETIAALGRAIASTQLKPDDLHAVLLVGGSSRIPLVAQMISEALGRPVAVDADPKHAIALGAALAGAPVAAAPVAEEAVTVAAAVPVAAPIPLAAPVAAAMPLPPPRPPIETPEPAWVRGDVPVERRSPSARRAAVLAFAVVAAFAVLSLIGSGAVRKLDETGSPAVAAPEASASPSAPATPPAETVPPPPASATAPPPPSQASAPAAFSPAAPAAAPQVPAAPPPAPSAPPPPAPPPIPQTSTALTG